MATEHKLVSGDIYRHGITYYLALLGEDNKWRSYVWGERTMYETIHWWDDPDTAHYKKEFIINIAAALTTVFD